MQQVTEFFSKLLGTESWPARWYCGTWSDFHGWLYILSDLAIWGSYFVIPFALAYFIIKKPNLPLPSIFWMFFAFIFLCGLTHLIDAVIFYVPIYRLSALVRFFTAVVSIGTVIALFKFMPHALALRTSKEFDEEIELRKTIEEKLEEQSLRLQAVNTELEQYAYVASHDLKEPLRTIQSSVEFLNNELAGTQNEKVQKVLGFSQSAAIRMQKLIDSLLEFSQLGKLEITENVDTNKIVSAVLAELDVLIKETDAKITLENLPVVSGNQQELHQLFQNLINNAIKFRKKDIAAIVLISAVEQEKDFVFSIKDNGIGIPEEQKEKVFQIFQRLHSNKEYTGTGIGLATCKKIVELHKGSIWFESEVGKGTTFYFTLPKNQEA